MKFTKMHGLGNSYIYIDLFKETLDEDTLPELAVKLADKNKGIGSDGMILIGPSDSADVSMRVFNNDGSEAMNCGNGLRCVAKFAYEHNYVDQKVFKIETKGGLVEATVHPDANNQVPTVTINMGAPRLSRAEIPMSGSAVDQVVNETFVLQDKEIKLTAVSMGNPHAVIFTEDIENIPLYEVGPALEKHERFPEWVNVEYVEVVTNDELHFRVWERGTGITQACGTGACAAAVASILNGHSQRGKEITVHLLGGDLMITWLENGDVLMNGAAETIFEGEWLL
ncbi:diaminopimelate epimerase [Alkalicoccobacillus murimartini]|uniref:Diaminopimelate epimerase n=1 Tax=Alkalicoccobacillus murimartini TaxID=171685 RepID=A0ABT9YHC4_9BACI|nr:diaminopimelate epimerase [Alkalicoccobacillus murimartini]MDQ0206592.1 diaminopimelate epimerase [Alkalicoccobacillus murimartini]